MTQGNDSAPKSSTYLKLLVLTCSAVLVHGYHLGTDDAEIYLPAVKKFLDPALYPFGDEFFMTHGRLSLFSDTLGLSARALHLSVDTAAFAWHIFGIFLLLLASLRLLESCFEGQRARWTGVSLLTAVLSVPVANTALVIMDPYLTARSISTPASIFAVSCLLSRSYKRALAWWLVTAFIHPQMSVYVLAFAVCLSLAHVRRRFPSLEPATAYGLAPAILSPATLPHGFAMEPAQGPYREALMMRTYFFVGSWAWYEWCGALFPLAILWGLALLPVRGTLPAFRAVCRTCAVFGGVSIAAALLISVPQRMQMFARLQPMRSLHLVYVILFLVLGALTGEYLLDRRPLLRAALLFVPLGIGMWFVGARTYPSSPHIEWPGLHWRSPYISAFLWIKSNTPKDAVFAIDPRYMNSPGVDEHGFRALAERSVLADYYKDSGAVSLFPQLAEEWKREVSAQEGWEHFQPEDYERLAGEFPVSWVVVEGVGPAGFDCPYRDQGVAVCRIPPAVAQQRAALQP